MLSLNSRGINAKRAVKQIHLLANVQISYSCNINDDCENTNHYKLYESDEEEND